MERTQWEETGLKWNGKRWECEEFHAVKEKFPETFGSLRGLMKKS
jgi:hypothetical protein